MALKPTPEGHIWMLEPVCGQRVLIPERNVEFATSRGCTPCEPGEGFGEPKEEKPAPKKDSKK